MQPDDPWARWRKPDETPAVDQPAKVKKAAPAPKAEAPVVTDAPAAKPAEKPAGTLGVLKSAGGQRSSKPPVRGGALARKPRPAFVNEPAADNAKPRGEGRFAKADTRRSEPRTERPTRPAPAKTSVRPVSAVAVAERDGPAPSGVRLSKVMSERGLCSRREADLWIERGWVFVDGEQISELGSRIDPAAEIKISTEAKKDQAKQVTILIHKPVGYVSGQPEPGCTPAVTLITAENQCPQSGDPEFKPWMLRGLAPAGRLDVDSTGLLVLTSDGRVAKKLIGEDSDAEKEYLVRVSGEMIKGGLELLRHGLELDGKPLRQAWVKQLNEDQLHFILKEGKKRQIRRMCELVGLRVIGLKRVRIGRIRLGDLPMGQWRFLRADEAF